MEGRLPRGMTGEMVEFDFREGGHYRMLLRYKEQQHIPGKTSADTDEVYVKLTRLIENELIVQSVTFESDDAKFAGDMKISWSFTSGDGGTLVEVRCDGAVPVSLSRPQRGVAIGIATGLGVTLAVLAMAALIGPLNGTHDSLYFRLQIFALSALVPTVALAVSIGRLAAHRFWTPQDIDGSGLASGTEKAKLLQALLQNTLEQLTLALPVYAVWSILAPMSLMAALPAAAALFLLGRVLFLWGYPRGAAGRSLGFALTFYPTLVLLVGAVILGLRVIIS